MRAWLLLVLVLSGCATPAGSTPVLTLGTTTTLHDSGLLDALLPAFERDTGIHVRAVVGGSGEVIAKAQHGDVDAILSHSPDAERALVAAGDGVARIPIMHNRFLVVGPAADPAGASDATDVTAALGRIYAHRAETAFASRADHSGTDTRERSLWASAGLDPSTFDAAWYKETGTGQSQTLLFADEVRAYALSDEATWMQLRGNGQLTHMRAIYQDDAPALRNDYAFVAVDATRHAGTHPDLAAAFAAWLTGPQGRAVLASYRVAGAQVFYPEG